MWKMYTATFKRINTGIDHLSVNDSLNFVDPEDRNIHNQNIEGLWSRSKYFIKKKNDSSLE